MVCDCVPSSFGAIAQCVSFSGHFPFPELTGCISTCVVSKSQAMELLAT